MPDRVAECSDVVCGPFEAPRARAAPVGTAVPAQIEVDDLGMLGEPAEVRLEVGMVIAARSAVNQDHRRPLPHLIAVRHERRPVNVEPQPSPIDVDMHQC